MAQTQHFCYQGQSSVQTAIRLDPDAVERAYMARQLVQMHSAAQQPRRCASVDAQKRQSDAGHSTRMEPPEKLLVGVPLWHGSRVGLRCRRQARAWRRNAEGILSSAIIHLE